LFRKKISGFVKKAAWRNCTLHGWWIVRNDVEKSSQAKRTPIDFNKFFLKCLCKDDCLLFSTNDTGIVVFSVAIVGPALQHEQFLAKRTWSSA